MGDTRATRATLGRGARTALALGLFAAIAALSYALPDQHLAVLEIVPCVLVGRAYGVRTGLIAALVSAPALDVLQHRLHVYGALPLAEDTVVLWAIFATLLLFVERYESALGRAHRAVTESLSHENAELMHEISVTLPVRAREEARARERELVSIAEALPQLVWRADKDGNPEYFNRAWHRYTGIDPDVMKRRGLRAGIHPSDMHLAEERFFAASRAKTVFEAQIRLRKADGHYRWFLARATPIENFEGHVFRWFGTCTDIDDQKRVEERLEKRFALAHRVSEAFQEASLPLVLPTVPGVVFSAIYRAGRREAAVGGDWYDALRLLDGRVVISIGDVAGSGLAAAITMVAMRQAIRGAAQIHADPMAILEAADRTLRQDAPETMVTAFVGVYDPVTRAMHYASAGHPPPMLRHGDGSVVELASPGLPLGVRRKGDTELGAIVLEPRSALVLYTDGLIESTHDVIAGLDRLRLAVSAIDGRSPLAAAEQIAKATLGDEARDDVAILTLGFDVEPDRESYRRWTFDCEDRFAAREVHRSFVATLVATGASDEQVRDAEVVFSELLGNVVRHARGPCEIVFDTTSPLPVLSILDRGRGMTHAAHLPADAFAESGRGLFIVRALTAEYNASRRPGGGTHARAVLYVDKFAPAPPRGQRVPALT